jgi:hypothetical protein
MCEERKKRRQNEIEQEVLVTPRWKLLRRQVHLLWKVRPSLKGVAVVSPTIGPIRSYLKRKSHGLACEIRVQKENCGFFSFSG